MLNQYVLFILRRLLRNPAYSFVNVIGLSVGIACAILVLLYVKDELSFDKHWSAADRIYRLGTIKNMIDGSGSTEFDNTYISVGPKIESTLPQVDLVARYVTMSFLVTHQENSFYESIRFSDASLFKIFDVKFIEGHRDSAFNETFSIVLTKSVAKKYFGEESALGNVLQFDVNHRFKVGGVIEDPRGNTHLESGLVANISSREQLYYPRINNNWNGPFATTYVQLAKGETPISIAQSLQAFTKDHVPEHLNLNFTLLPVSDIHGKESSLGGQSNLAILTVTSLLILLMACINTVNLSTAKGAERNKELGVRKALGASRSQLVIQLILETLILAMLALVVALFIVELVLGMFNNLTDKTLTFNYVSNISLLGQFILIAFVTGILAGAYPAFVFSSFKPVEVFRGSSKFGTGPINIRKLLLIAQFAIAVSLSIFSLIIYQQLQYMKNMDLGFDENGLVVMHNIGWTDIKGNNNFLRTELLNHPEITYVAESSIVPSKNVVSNASGFYPLGKSREQGVSLNRLSVGYDFFNAYQVKLVAGRAFSKKYGTDEVSFKNTSETEIYSTVVNYSAVEKFGWSSPESTIGKIVKSSDPAWPFSLKIIGVVEDFHMSAGHGHLEPYIFIAHPKGAQYMSIKLSGKNVAGALTHMDDMWASINPQYPVVRSFLDTDLESAYERWEKNSQIMAVLIVVTIVISIIGSFSLSAFTIRLRNKEICMRKLVGASTFDITKLFIKDFSKPVLMANAIAIPFGFYVSSHWLSEFVYRINLTPTAFLLVFIVSMVLCWISVSFNIIKVSRMHLSKTLRYI